MGREIFIFTVMLCGIFFIFALRLNFLVGRSILSPIGEMLGVIDGVRHGEFTPRIRILSNDELGVLGDADQAVLAALGMRKRLEALNLMRKDEGKPPFLHGIGIHTGIVLAGNTGSEDRLSYALIGDTVNLASRIQDLTKVFDCDILISEETVERLGRSFQMAKKPSQRVKGYSKPVTVHQIL